MLEWTERQMEVARVASRADSQQEAADELGVAQSTVSRSLSSAAYGRVRPALDAFRAVLDETSREDAP